MGLFSKEEKAIINNLLRSNGAMGAAEIAKLIIKTGLMPLTEAQRAKLQSTVNNCRTELRTKGEVAPIRPGKTEAEPSSSSPAPSAATPPISSVDLLDPTGLPSIYEYAPRSTPAKRSKPAPRAPLVWPDQIDRTAQLVPLLEGTDAIFNMLLLGVHIVPETVTYAFRLPSYATALAELDEADGIEVEVEFGPIPPHVLDWATSSKYFVPPVRYSDVRRFRFKLPLPDNIDRTKGFHTPALVKHASPHSLDALESTFQVIVHREKDSRLPKV